MSESTGATTTERAAITSRHIGSVFLVGTSHDGVKATRRVTDRVRTLAPGSIKILVSADQEGGLVQRLQGPGFTRIPTASHQGTLSTSTLRTDAKKWGAQLRSAGVDLDLAPVADVVPTSMESTNQPIGVLHRGFGSNPTKVATHVNAFIDGMRDSTRATTAKHFPGLGRVLGNTDYSGGVVDKVTTRHDAYLKPFKAAVANDVPVVMISLATYTKLDARQSAVFSHPIVTDMLRHDIGFTGVITSDDLGVAAEVKSITPGNRALRFIRAGGDLITVTSTSAAVAMAKAIVATMKADPAFATIARTAAQRVLVLKHQLGLATC